MVDNAIKFTKNGEISIEVNHVGELFEFRVQDTGIGIDQKNIQKLFKPFNQLDSSISRQYGGTGLGLAISRELVKMMGGNIHVESMEGEGSTFIFNVRLEISDDVVITETISERTDIENIKSDLRILIAEDNVVNCRVIEEILKTYAINCDKAIDGREAYEMALQNDYDIIFMDCQMPVMTGYESTAKIRSFEGKRKHIIIAMTANAMEGDREKCLEAGMDDYISKPIDFEALLRMISKYRKIN